MSGTKIIFWKCVYLKYAYKGTGPYCMLHRPEFGNCQECPEYKKQRDIILNLGL